MYASRFLSHVSKPLRFHITHHLPHPPNTIRHYHALTMPYDRASLFDLSGRVALVTGGGSGIGLMIAQTLATNGARVYITGRNKDKLDRAIAAHKSALPADSLIPITADVTDKSSIQNLYDDISSREKCLCILVNNAGVSSSRVDLSSGSPGDAQALRKAAFESDDATFENWDQTLRTNVASPYFVTMAFAPLLQASSEKHPGWSATVINICSISGSVQSSQTGQFPYNSSKAAALHLTRMLAYEFSQQVGEKKGDSVQAGAGQGLRIRVNAISPGIFPSEMTAGESGEDQKSQLSAGSGANAPARRPGRDEDMASTVLFAAANQYINGQNFVVDGGIEMAFGR
jgi:NAD(P)-dependent dehydrogenase (short-subunit alcohol dehydrogenase family)